MVFLYLYKVTQNFVQDAAFFPPDGGHGFH